MSIEAMKQALEALDEITDDVDGTGLNTTMSFDKSLEAITSLRQAIEQAEKQEPFGYFQYSMHMDAWVQNRDSNKGVAFYTTPPAAPVQKPMHPEIKKLYEDFFDKHFAETQREWVGLTLDEIDLLEELYAPPVHPDFANDASHCLELIRHVEAKLKEKNNG